MSRFVNRLGQRRGSTTRNAITTARQRILQRQEQEKQQRLQLLDRELNNFNRYKGSSSTQSNQLFDRPFNNSYLFISSKGTSTTIPFHTGTYREFVYNPSNNTVQIITRQTTIKEYRTVGSFGSNVPRLETKTLNVRNITLASPEAKQLVQSRLSSKGTPTSFGQETASRQKLKIQSEVAKRQEIQDLINQTGNTGKITVAQVQKNPALLGQLQRKVAGVSKGTTSEIAQKKSAIARGQRPTTIGGLSRGEQKRIAIEPDLTVNKVLSRARRNKVSPSVQLDREIKRIETERRKAEVKAGTRPSSIGGLSRKEQNEIAKTDGYTVSKVLRDAKIKGVEPSLWWSAVKEGIRKENEPRTKEEALILLNSIPNFNPKNERGALAKQVSRAFDKLYLDEIIKNKSWSTTAFLEFQNIISLEAKRKILDKYKKELGVTYIRKDKQYSIRVNDNNDIQVWIYDPKTGKVSRGTRGLRTSFALANIGFPLKKAEFKNILNKSVKNVKRINLAKKQGWYNLSDIIWETGKFIAGRPVGFVNAGFKFGIEELANLGKLNTKLIKGEVSASELFKLGNRLGTEISIVDGKATLTPNRKQLATIEEKIRFYNTSDKNLNRLLSNSDFKVVSFWIILALSIYFGGLATNWFSKIGLPLAQAGKYGKLIKSLTRTTPFIGKVGRGVRTVKTVGIKGIETYFGVSAGNNFLKNPNRKTFTEMILFGLPLANDLKTGVKILSGKTIATVRNLDEMIPYAQKSKGLAKLQIKNLKSSLNAIKVSKEKVRVQKEIRRLEKYVIAIEKYIVTLRLLENSTKVWKVQDYSLIKSARDIIKYIGKPVEGFHITSTSFNKLFGGLFLELAKTEDEIKALAKIYSKEAKITQKRGLSFNAITDIEKEILKIFKRNGVVLGGGKALNINVGKRLARQTSDFDGVALKNNPESVINQLEKALNKLKGNSGRFRSLKRKAIDGKLDVYYLYDTKNKISLIELKRLSDIKNIKDFSYVLTKEGLLIESKASLLLSKANAIIDRERYRSKGLIDVDDFIKLTDNKLKTKELLKVVKDPNDILRVVAFPSEMGADRKRFKEFQFFLSLFKVFVGYGLANITKQAIWKYLLKEWFGFNNFRGFRTRGKLGKLSPELTKRVNKALKGKLSIREQNKLRNDIVTYINKTNPELLPPSRTLSKGAGEEEIILKEGALFQKKSNKIKEFYEPELGQLVKILLDVEVKGKGLSKKELLALDKVNKVSVLDRYSLKLSNPDLRESKLILRMVRENNRITRGDVDKISSIAKRYIKKLSIGLRKEFEKIKNKIPFEFKKRKEFFEKVKAISDVLKNIGSKYKDIKLFIRNNENIRKTIKSIKDIKRNVSNKTFNSIKKVEKVLGNANIKFKFEFNKRAVQVKDISSITLKKINKLNLRLSRAVRKYVNEPTREAFNSLKSIVNSINNEFSKLNFKIKVLKYDSQELIKDIGQSVSLRLDFTFRRKIKRPILNSKTYNKITKTVKEIERLIKKGKSYTSKEVRKLINTVKKELSKVGLKLIVKYNKSKKVLTFLVNELKSFKEATKQIPLEFKRTGNKYIVKPSLRVVSGLNKRTINSVKYVGDRLHNVGLTVSFSLYKKGSKYGSMTTGAFKAIKNIVELISIYSKTLIKSKGITLDKKLRNLLGRLKRELNKYGITISTTLRKSKKFAKKKAKEVKISLANIRTLRKLKRITNKKISSIKSSIKSKEKRVKDFLNKKGYSIKVGKYNVEQLTLKQTDKLEGLFIQLLRISDRKLVAFDKRVESIVQKIKEFIPFKLVKRKKLKNKLKEIKIKRSKKRIKGRRKVKKKLKIKGRTKKTPTRKISVKSKLKSERLKEKQLRKKGKLEQRRERAKLKRKALRQALRIRKTKRPLKRKLSSRERPRKRVSKSRVNKRARTTRTRLTRSRVRTTRARTRLARSRNRITRGRTRLSRERPRPTRTRMGRGRPRPTRGRIPPTKIPPVKIFNINIKPTLNQLKKYRKIDVYVKKAGRKTRYVRANAGYLTPSNAINFAKYVTDNTKLASYVLRPSKLKNKQVFKAKTPSIKFRRPKRTSKLPQQARVEKRKYRLDKVGERRDISIAKLRKLKNAKKVKKYIKGKKKSKRNKNKK
jgi:hypothetical protein